MAASCGADAGESGGGATRTAVSAAGGVTSSTLSLLGSRLLSRCRAMSRPAASGSFLKNDEFLVVLKSPSAVDAVTMDPFIAVILSGCGL